MSSRKSERDDLESLLNTFLRQSEGERLGDSLADEVAQEANREILGDSTRHRARAAARRATFDGKVARARASLVGGLGAFGTALRRIREAAQCSLDEMAERAGISASTWADLEEQRTSADCIELEQLVSIVEAAQLRRSELRAALRAQKVRLHLGGQASFRADHVGGIDTRAAHEDLMAALSDEAGLHANDSDEEAIDALVERVSNVLRRRGRHELL